MRLTLLFGVLLGIMGQSAYAQRPTDLLLLERLRPLTQRLTAPDTVLDGWAVRLASEQVDTEAIGFRFGVFCDERPAIVVGRFLNPQALHALILPLNDSIQRLYTLMPEGQWHQAAVARGLFAGLSRIGFEDLDGDGQREIILASGPMMNGNFGWAFLSYDAGAGRLHSTGELVGDFIADVPGRRLRFYQDGGILGDHSRTLYLWRRHRLVPVRQTVLKKDLAGHCTLHYYANPQFVTKTPLRPTASRTDQGLMEIFRKRLGEDAHGNPIFGKYARYWDNFFKW